MRSITFLRYGIIGMLLWLGIGAGILLLYSLYIAKYDVTAGSFAVIVSTISAAFAYEIIHKDRINQLPLVTVEFDDQSRFQLFQLVVKNIGGSTAFNIQIEWLEKSVDDNFSYIIPKNNKGNPLRFHKEEQYNRILALQKGCSHYILVDFWNDFFEKNKPAYFLAKITYEDSFGGGEKYLHYIPISMEENLWTLDHIDEKLKAEHEIQKLPKKLEEIKNQLDKLNKSKVVELERLQVLIESFQKKG